MTAGTVPSGSLAALGHWAHSTLTLVSGSGGVTVGLDIGTTSVKAVAVGDELTFAVDYGALVRAMTSPHVATTLTGGASRPG